MRLTTGRVDSSFLQARNTLTQRTIGPESSATIKIDISGMKEGDYAGLALLQKDFGIVGVKYENGLKSIIMINADGEEAVEVEEIPLNQDILYLKADGDFRNMNDKATFFYSLDGEQWNQIGDELTMSYTIPHFMGYRFGLFNYAAKNAGGHVDFDYFKIDDQISKE
ncbi:hypothetical protein [Autumnicola lenta]|uniref:beta-xylosidase family glycoside hydrolase n=1 Tax=Autumnicola lenta TaxID=3075593 RepID=UPI0032C21B0D